MTAFSKLEEGRNPMRTVLEFTVEEADGLWNFRTVADGYLWNQVRRMVGAVQAVGRGEAEVADIQDSLKSGEKHDAFHLASPAGLLLERIEHEGIGWDSYAGRLGSVLQGSTETTFYVLSVYCGSVGIVRYRHALAAGLLADFTGLTASVLIARMLWM